MTSHIGRVFVPKVQIYDEQEFIVLDQLQNTAALQNIVTKQIVWESLAQLKVNYKLKGDKNVD